MDALHHYLPVEPFFHENAIQLKDLALLDVVPLQQTLPRVGLVSRDDQNAPKLLKVPRQVRDHVQTLLSDEERREIVAAGAERFFGRKWREGRVKLRSLPGEYRDYLSSGAGNEFAVIHHLIAEGRKASDQSSVRKAARLGIFYCRHLISADRYRDLEIVAAALVQSVDRDKHPNEWSELASLYGEGLRMMDKDEECIKYSHAALELGGRHFSEDEKGSIWLAIAFSNKDLHNKEAAVMAAENAKQYSKPGSPDHFSAMVTLAVPEFRATGSEDTAHKTSKASDPERLYRDCKQYLVFFGTRL